MTTTTDPDPWDRQRGETPKAYAAFLKYRDDGPFFRSLRTLAAREPGTNLAQLGVWSRTHGWVDRVDAWDNHVERLNQIDQVEHAAAMRRRHAAIGFEMLDLCAERIRSIKPDDMSIRDTIALADLAIRIERQARGDILDPATILERAKAEQEVSGPTGADILTALRTHPQLLDLAEELDRVMLEGAGD